MYVLYKYSKEKTNTIILIKYVPISYTREATYQTKIINIKI